METSAYTGENINEIFETIGAEILEDFQDQESAPVPLGNTKKRNLIRTKMLLKVFILSLDYFRLCFMFSCLKIG